MFIIVGFLIYCKMILHQIKFFKFTILNLKLVICMPIVSPEERTKIG